jgi:ketosteroid isomerase-like protein
VRVREDVTEAIEEWADSTRDHDIDDHMKAYASTLDTYYMKRGVSNSQVRADRVRTFERYQRINVGVSNIQVKPDATGQRATVTLDKTWEFIANDRRSTGSVKQQLVLTKFGDRWLITGEKDLEVHYKNSEDF